MAEESDDKEIILEADAELRFEVENPNESVTLTLLSGFAEIFGTELVKSRPYTFKTGAKIAVFTWQGCTLELKGVCDRYIAKETPMVIGNQNIMQNLEVLTNQ